MTLGLVDQLERKKSLSTYWFNKASDLKASAGALWFVIREGKDQAHDFLRYDSSFDLGVAVWPVYTMLCGMSLELLYKAIILERGQEPEKTHDLCRLASAASVVVDVEEIPTLRILSSYISWVGRYPVPTGKDPRTSFEEHVKLEWDHLWEVNGNSMTPIKHRNEKLTWPNVEKLWRTASTVYRNLRQ